MSDAVDVAVAYRARHALALEARLREGLLEEGGPSGLLSEPLGYWFDTPGKRWRGCLTLMACEAEGGSSDAALDAACAIEYVHTASLILDDLPCMDNAGWRRGQPSLHSVYGESTAVLVSFALFNLAHLWLAGLRTPSGESVHSLASRRFGGFGMIAGQETDLRLAQGRPLPPGLDAGPWKLCKATSLIAASLEIGSTLGGASPSRARQLGHLGEEIGALLQYADDVRDEDVGYGCGDRRSVAQQYARVSRSIRRCFRPRVAAREITEGLAFILVQAACSAGDMPSALLPASPVGAPA